MYKLLIDLYYKIVRYQTLKNVKKSSPKTLKIFIIREGLQFFGV